MSLKTLAARNKIEDHEVKTAWVTTEDMVADIGTKSLPPLRFKKLRDVMNGYALVKVAYPNKKLPGMVFEGGKVSLKDFKLMVMGFTYSPTSSE